MKLDKKLKSLEWGKINGLSGMQSHQVTVRKKQDGSRYIYVIDFIHNPRYQSYGYAGEDFRVYVSKKERDYAVITRGGKRLRDFKRLLPRHPMYIYIDICKEDEDKLHTLTGKESGNHQVDTLYYLCEEYREERRKAQAKARGEFTDEEISLCPEELPEGLENWIRTEILPKDHTLIYKKGNVRGRCHLCGREVRRTGKRFIQHQTVSCPDCGETVICILEGSAAWRSDYVDNIIFPQRGKDGESVWFREFHLFRDYSCEYKDIKQYLGECVRYAVRGKYAAMWMHERKEQTFMGRAYPYRLKNWERSGKIYIYDGGIYSLMKEGFEEAIQSTRLKYIEADKLLSFRNPLKLMLDIIRYPCLEYLMKNGFDSLLRDKVLYGLSKETANVCRWKAEKVKDFFKIPVRILKHAEPKDWGALELKAANEICAWDKITDAEIANISINNRLKSAVDIARKYKPIKSILSYIENGEEETGDIYFSSIYKDYLDECETLEFDIKDKNVIFPKDLQAAHERTSALVIEKRDDINKRKFAAAIKPLKSFNFEADGILIFAAPSASALAREGAALHHCVGTYAERVSRGQTAIFLIRKRDQKNKSFYTLEYQNGKVIQCRGKNNCSYTQNEEIKAFVDKWLKFVAKKRREIKCKKSA